MFDHFGANAATWRDASAKDPDVAASDRGDGASGELVSRRYHRNTAAGPGSAKPRRGPEGGSMASETDESRNLATARRYLAALEGREDPAVIAGMLHPDLVQEEFPNRLNPRGARSDRAAMLERLARGRQILASERYEVVDALAVADRVALEVRWSGILAVSLGDALPAGSTMRARFAVFLAFRDGQIVAQRNYDCFDPG